MQLDMAAGTLGLLSPLIRVEKIGGGRGKGAGMSEQVTVVHSNDTDEVKVFAGEKLIGQYKTLLDAIGQLATFVRELTAAQQRVAELEQLQANLVMLVIRLSRRVRGFDNECKVRKQCLEYLSKNGLVPSVLRENENE
jgi:hypothetical protein